MSPGATPDDATAAINEGKGYPAPTDDATDACPKKDAAAATADGCDIALALTPGNGSWIKESLDELVRYKLGKACLIAAFEG